MKIALSQKEGVAILEVSDGLESRDFQVLKAGLSKLLKDGKNKIILHFKNVKALESSVIHEIAILDVFARELSGKIILCSDNADLKQSITQFSKPPIIPFLTSIEDAVDFFQQSKDGSAETDFEVLQSQLKEKEKQIASLTAQLKVLNPTELMKVRAENANYKKRVQSLEHQVEELLLHKREIVDAEGFLDKITALENTVKKLSSASMEGKK